MYISVTPLLLPCILLWASICHFHMALHPLLTNPWLRPIHHSRECAHLLSAQAGNGKNKQHRKENTTWNQQNLSKLLLSSNHLAIPLFDISPLFSCNVIVITHFTIREVKYSFDCSAEGEWNHNTSCPGGGDTGMQSSQSAGRRHNSRLWSKEQHLSWNQNYNVRENNRKNTDNNNQTSNVINHKKGRLSRNITEVNGIRKYITLPQK